MKITQKDVAVSKSKKESSNQITINFMNDMQKEFAKSINDKEITIAIGPPGTAKTYIACAVALQKLLNQDFEKIYIIKSVTSLEGEAIGFLKGDMDEKMDPIMMSFKMNFNKLLDEKRIEGFFQSKKIEVLPLAYLRGVNLDNCIIIADETQNLSRFNFRTLLTRLGSNAKMIVLGDTKQSDLKDKSKSVLQDVFDILNDDKIGKIQFKREHIVRNPLIIKIEDEFEKRWG